MIIDSRYNRFSISIVISLFLLLFLSSFIYAADITTDLDNNRLDIGIVDEGEVLNKYFFVINNSDSPVTISVEVLGCGCFDVVKPEGKIELAAHAKEKVEINFDTAGFYGRTSKPLYIYAQNSDIDSVIKVEVTADVAVKKEVLIERFASFSSLTVLTAGLVDGINPCAFTVMVFFMSFLTFAGYRKKAMFIVGGLFIFAVYLTYVLIGVGLFKTLQSLDILFYLSNVFFVAIAGFAFILGTINIYDYIIYKKTKDADRIVLKLPSSIKRKIQKAVRKELIKEDPGARNMLGLIIASLSCGFLVSVLELFCTGQLYLPTVVYILRIPELRTRAIAQLLLYNFMFILPLIGVFALTFVGFTSSRFERLARNHLAIVKLATALLFFAMSVALFSLN